MAEGYLAFIQPLTGSGHPDQGLPGLSPGSPSHPIYHPGHPDHGLPSQPGSPSHPIQGVPPGPNQGLPGQSPGAPAHPIQPVGPGPSHPIQLPEGGQPLPGLPPPAGHENEMVVAVYKPGQGWTAKSYPVQPDQGQPQPTPRR